MRTTPRRDPNAKNHAATRRMPPTLVLPPLSQVEFSVPDQTAPKVRHALARTRGIRNCTRTTQGGQVAFGFWIHRSRLKEIDVLASKFGFQTKIADYLQIVVEDLQRHVLCYCAERQQGMPRRLVLREMRGLIGGRNLPTAYRAKLVSFVLRDQLQNHDLNRSAGNLLCTNRKKHPAVWNGGFCQQQRDANRLLMAAKRRLPRLRKLFEQSSGHWGYEDPIYRFYHQSFKVCRLKPRIQEIMDELLAIAPTREYHLSLPGLPHWEEKLNRDFLNIISQADPKKGKISPHPDTIGEPRRLVEGFFHTRHMLEMLVKYAAKLEVAPRLLPSGWATVLYLFNLR